jgi:hypothetical protein
MKSEEAAHTRPGEVYARDCRRGGPPANDRATLKLLQVSWSRNTPCILMVSLISVCSAVEHRAGVSAAWHHQGAQENRRRRHRAPRNRRGLRQERQSRHRWACMGCPIRQAAGRTAFSQQQRKHCAPGARRRRRRRRGAHSRGARAQLSLSVRVRGAGLAAARRTLPGKHARAALQPCASTAAATLPLVPLPPLQHWNTLPAGRRNPRQRDPDKV